VSLSLSLSLSPALEKALLKSLRCLDDFLRTPLAEELEGGGVGGGVGAGVGGGDPPESRRSFLDGDELTLADCNLLPKLHILKVLPVAVTTLWEGDGRSSSHLLTISQS